MHEMFRGSAMMQFLVVGYIMSIAIYNSAVMQLCRKLSVVTRCLVDCMRTATVRGFQLDIHYFVSKGMGRLGVSIVAFS